MDVTTELKKHIHDLIDIARLAPSVHNSQPWRISAQGDTIHIAIDKQHALRAGDPTGRQTYSSLGIIAEALTAVAESKGFVLREAALKENAAVVKLGLASPINGATDDSNVAALRSRCTDRSIYTPIAISEDTVKVIESSSHFPGVSIRVVTDRTLIEQVAALTSQGIGLALSNPEFRQELSTYLALPWSGKHRGISTESLRIPRLLSYMEPTFMKLGLGIKKELVVERKRWESASGLVCITTKGDLYEDWFTAGRAYLRTSLCIEKLGLHQATSAATVEASNFHEDIEEALHTSERLQSVTRIGKSSAKKVYSSRLPVEALLVTSSL